MFEKLRKNLSRVIYSAKNSMSIPQQFLKYGSSKTMYPDWSQVMMSDPDHYTGYSYAAITKRARATARVATQFLTTKLPEDDSKKDFVHPYIALIKESTDFSENTFWQTISTYIDLEGVYYLMVLRNSDAETARIGTAKRLKLLNPYNIQRVIKEGTLEVGGYIENRKGWTRTIPAEMIIPIFELNPFDEDKPYAMTDAARESSYTLKSAGDYTRHGLRNNVDAPGIITTDVIMPEPEFLNFVARMKDHNKGEPVFGNGANSVKWTPMAIDMSKAALKEITEVNRDTLFAVTGMSKTIMGIEQSGTTRETSNTQKDLFIENEIVPRVNLVLDALNLDYKTRYAKEYIANKAMLGLNNPIESDQEVEGKKAENKTKNYDLFKKLVDDGYEEKVASQFVNGEITLEKLGKPTNDPKPDPVAAGTVPALPAPKDKKGRGKQFLRLNDISRGQVQDQESFLQNSVVNIEGQLAVAAINRVPKLVKNDTAKNDIDSESDLITKKDKKEAINELILVLTAFYGIVTMIQGKDTIKDRIAKYGGEARYLLDKISKDGIKKTAEAVAKSHVDTVSAELYKIAREAALKGKSQLEIIGEIKSAYSHDITEIRARLVARTETNRAFTMAQFDADRQFIEQNQLEERAFKRYHTRSDNPCAFCKSLESAGLVPFEDPFVKKGDTVTAKVDGKEVKFNVSFQDVHAGNLHPNCSCDYELVIVKEKK